MRKVRPIDVRETLHEKVDQLLELHSQCLEHLLAQHNAGALTYTANQLASLLSEQSMMIAAVAWEIFISELFVCYINRDSALFVADLKNRFKSSISVAQHINRRLRILRPQ